MKSVLWASEGFNRSVTTANSGMFSSYKVFYGSRPTMPALPFCILAYHRVPRQGKLDRQARPCYFLNFGYNHGSDCMEIMDAETGRIMPSRDVTWHQPREPLISPAPQLGRKCLSCRPVPTRRIMYTFSRPLPPPLRLVPRRCLRRITPHPRRHETRPPQSVIALFGSWDTRPTWACLVARRAKREQCGRLRTAWVWYLTPLWHKR